MDVKAAVARAKELLSEAFASEEIHPPTLEEVWLDEAKEAWSVTLGVRRRQKSVSVLSDIHHGEIDPLGRRIRPEYKVVVLESHSGKLLSIRDRSFVEAA
jgi:hypothetical protein